MVEIALYDGLNVVIMRTAEPTDKGYDPEHDGEQLLIQLPNCEERVVPRIEVQTAG